MKTKTKKKLMQMSSFIDNNLNNFTSSVVSSLQRLRLLAPKMGSVLSIPHQDNTAGTGCMQ